MCIRLAKLFSMKNQSVTVAKAEKYTFKMRQFLKKKMKIFGLKNKNEKQICLSWFRFGQMKNKQLHFEVSKKKKKKK